MQDYWDVDRAIFEDHPLTCKFVAAVPGVGWLDPFTRQRQLEDIPQDTKTELPFWLVEELTKLGFTTVDCPNMYSPAFKDMLLRGSLQLRTKDKSGYYFELGTRYAYLTEDTSLANALIRGITVRLQNIVTTTLGNPPRSESEENAFTYPLSASEEQTFTSCRAASVDLANWRSGDSRTLRPAANSILPRELLLP